MNLNFILYAYIQRCRISQIESMINQITPHLIISLRNYERKRTQRI